MVNNKKQLETTNFNFLETDLQSILRYINDERMQSVDLSREILDCIIKSAGTAPSGANQQPWTYAIIESDQQKHNILSSINLNSNDEVNYAYLIAIFKQNYGIKNNTMELNAKDEKVKHYYPQEGVSLSTGFFLSALQYAGIKCDVLPQASSLNILLDRPKNEVPFLLFGITDKCNNKNSYALVHDYYDLISQRRSVRKYSQKSFNIELLQKAISNVRTLLHHYVSELEFDFEIIESEQVKKDIREKAEYNEQRLYEELITDEWRSALKPLKTDATKQHLTDAPYLIIVFFKKVMRTEIIDPKTQAGIATGMLIQMIHRLGLSTLTYTPSPMAFLNKLLSKEASNRPFMVLPIGYRANDYKPPEITRKSLTEYVVTY